MTQIELIPDIDHCIETVAKQRYAEIVRRLFTSGENNAELFEVGRILKNFLETADFKKLRVESERHLAEGKRVKLVLREDREVQEYHLQVSP